MDVVASTIEAEQGCPKHTPRLALWRDLGMQTGGYISKGRAPNKQRRRSGFTFRSLNAPTDWAMPSRRESGGYDLAWLQTLSLSGLQKLGKLHGAVGLR